MILFCNCRKENLSIWREPESCDEVCAPCERNGEYNVDLARSLSSRALIGGKCPWTVPAVCEWCRGADG